VGTPRAFLGVLEKYHFFNISNTKYFHYCFFTPALVYISFLFILHAIFRIAPPLGRDYNIFYIEGAENEEEDAVVSQLFMTGKVIFRV
jgi:hypothetical protein